MRFPVLEASSIFWGAMAEIAVNSAFVFASLFVWSIVCFLFLRFSRAETEWRMKDFLQAHYSLFIYGATGRRQFRVTEEMVRTAGSKGWISVLIPILGGFFYHWNIGFIALAVVVPFFGGLLFAWSWYGVRCFHRLEIDSY